MQGIEIVLQRLEASQPDLTSESVKHIYHKVVPGVAQTCGLGRCENLIPDSPESPCGHFTGEQAAVFGKKSYREIYFLK